jgi:hypothetical protein
MVIILIGIKLAEVYLNASPECYVMTITLDWVAFIEEVSNFLSIRRGDLERNLPQFLQDFGDILAKKGIILTGVYDAGKNPGGFGTLSINVGNKIIEARIPLSTASSGYVGELPQKPSAYKACYH